MTVAVRPFRAMFVAGACASVFNEAKTVCRRLSSAGVRGSTRVPCSIAGLITGRVVRSDAVAGVSARPSVARSPRNGCCAASDWVETWSVEGDSAIVFSSADALREIAPKVVPMSPNSSASVEETGESVCVSPFSDVRNGVSPVLGCDR